MLAFGVGDTRCGFREQILRLRRSSRAPHWGGHLLLAGTVLIAALALTAGRPAPAIGGAISAPAGCDTNSLPRNDDGSTGRIALPFAINYFGTTYSSLFVNNNGNVTFDTALGTYTPFNLLSTAQVIIAPFFADVDTRGAGSAVVTYGQATFGGRPAFCAEWRNVGYYAGRTDKLNSFELLLVDRSDQGVGDFDIVFNYDQIKWETGEASGGSGGLGGSSARAGYSNGTNASLELDGSAVNGAFLDASPQGLVHRSRNSLEAGRYVFAVRNGAAPVGGTISGHVYQGTVGNALSGALVSICKEAACTTTATDTTGAYLASGLPAGDYTVRAFGPAGSSLLPGVLQVTLFAGLISAGNDLVLHEPPAGTPSPISGTVKTPGGAGVDGATVTLLRSESGAAGTFVVVPDGSAIMSPSNRTNPMLSRSDGSFGWDVFQGAYRVRAQKAGCTPAEGVESATQNVTSTSLLTGIALQLTCAAEPGPQVPDLALTKTASPTSTILGGTITYTLTATNHGTANATGVTVSDTLPAGVTFVSAQTTAGSCPADPPIQCAIGTLAPNGSATVTIVVTANATGSPDNTASVQGEEADPTPNDASAHATVTVTQEEPPPPPEPASSDISLTKTASNAVVSNGAGLTYTITAKNNGPDPATSVTVTDRLPSGLSFVGATASQGSCSGTRCVVGSLAVGASATVRLQGNASSPGFVTNDAHVVAAESDPQPGNNNAFVTVRVIPRIDLSVRGSAVPEVVGAANNLTYRFVVANGGPDTAAGSLLQVPLPAGATFVSATPTQGYCLNLNAVLCFLGGLASGASATVDVVVDPTGPGQYETTGSVSSDGGADRDGSNNNARVTGTVSEPFDLRLQMTATPKSIGAGAWITYTLDVMNLGPGAAPQVNLTDTLPDGVNPVSCTASQGDCGGGSFLRLGAAQSVRASLGRLDPNAAATVKIVARATAAGVAQNSASATGGGEDPALLTNNDATTSSRVTPKQFQPPADVPPPVLNKNVDAEPSRGTVLFRRPGSNAFEPLAAGEQLPLGTEFDTTKGAMLLTSASDATGVVQTAEFFDGYFTVQQISSLRRRRNVVLTRLTLTRGDFSACGSRHLAKRPPKRGKGAKPARQLWGHGTGNFQTKGKYSAATVRGTFWLTSDRCDGTFTQVREGVVTVYDLIRRSLVIVRAGDSYLARPRP